MSTDDRIARLPQWAQRHIERLEREREHAEARLAEVLGESAEEADTVVERGYKQDPLRLPARSRVRFGNAPRRRIQARWEDDALVLLGDGALSIEPHVTNHVSVRVVER